MSAELGCGTLYAKLCRKLTENMIQRFQWWLHIEQKFESVEALKEWVMIECEIQVIAKEQRKDSHQGRLQNKLHHHILQLIGSM